MQFGLKVSVPYDQINGKRLPVKPSLSYATAGNSQGAGSDPRAVVAHCSCLGDGSVYTRGRWAASQARPGQWVSEYSSGGGQATYHVTMLSGSHCGRGVTA